ncbi:hypothetical protein JX265_010309 [Neoarthrinium moseri]|uniref:Aminoglycoside phosphotransferase domain-containing protein n=1 Tax=Neoarthrinium moseri TaxID=1658444 RepID=A0A9P9WES7_9PEZI|nr:hypothetical protein JX265_010309 [Neoarthrinium moseri]
MDQLIHNILSTEIKREIVAFGIDPNSNNSRVYHITVKVEESEEPTQASGQAGTEPLPAGTTKLILRFTDPAANLNNDVLVESEVASMALARAALTSLARPIVPRVYGWKQASTRGQEVGWILMEYLPAQIAKIFRSIQQYDLPASVQGYGGLAFANDGSIVVGATPIYGARGVCKIYYELYRQCLETQLKFLDVSDIIGGWKELEFNLRERIEAFVKNGFMSLLEASTDAKPRPTLVHGDFGQPLFIYTTSYLTRKLILFTALLDFNFSHIASRADELFYLFDQLHSLLVPRGAVDLLREQLLHGFGEKKTESEISGWIDWERAMLIDEAFVAAGVQRPVDMMPGIEPLSDLYWFLQNISPGILFLPQFLLKASPERIQAKKKQVAGDLERT